MDALKLLIADDNEDFRQALADALQGAYYVRTCRTGREALTLLHSYRPDVLVLNLLNLSVFQLGLKFLGLLVHAVADESTCTCTYCRTDGCTDACAFTAPDEGADTCAEGAAATAADEGAFAGVGHRVTSGE